MAARAARSAARACGAIGTLHEEGLDQDTLVVFTSGNGPWLTQDLAGGSAGLLQGGKGSTWEGGTRVPCIARRPGTIRGGTVSSEPACNLDLFNTALDVAGEPLPSDRIVDGVSLTPLFSGRRSMRECFFYHRGADVYAVRMKGFKAHYITRSGYGNDAAVKHNPPLLFNLPQDPSERFNVASGQPEVLRKIDQALHDHRAGLGKTRFILDEIEAPATAPARPATLRSIPA